MAPRLGRTPGSTPIVIFKHQQDKFQNWALQKLHFVDSPSILIKRGVC